MFVQVIGDYNNKKYIPIRDICLIYVGTDCTAVHVDGARYKILHEDVQRISSNFISISYTLINIDHIIEIDSCHIKMRSMYTIQEPDYNDVDQYGRYKYINKRYNDTISLYEPIQDTIKKITEFAFDHAIEKTIYTHNLETDK